MHDGQSEREPTHKRVAFLHRSPTYGPIRIYAPAVGVVASGDWVNVGGHELTPEEMRRGWYEQSENGSEVEDWGPHLNRMLEDES